MPATANHRFRTICTLSAASLSLVLIFANPPCCGNGTQTWIWTVPYPDSDDSRFRKPPKQTPQSGGLFHIIDADRRFTNIATVPGTKSTNSCIGKILPSLSVGDDCVAYTSRTGYDAADFHIHTAARFDTCNQSLTFFGFRDFRTQFAITGFTNLRHLLEISPADSRNSQKQVRRCWPGCLPLRMRGVRTGLIVFVRTHSRWWPSDADRLRLVWPRRCANTSGCLSHATNPYRNRNRRQTGMVSSTYCGACSTIDDRSGFVCSARVRGSNRIAAVTYCYLGLFYRKVGVFPKHSP